MRVMNTRRLEEPLVGYTIAGLGPVLMTAVLASYRDEVGLLNVGLLFLLFTLLVSSVWGRWPGIAAAITANLALNAFFIEPFYHLAVEELRNVVALVVFLIVSVVGGSLLSLARASAAEARRREAETAASLSLSHAMSSETEPARALEALCREVVASFDAPGSAVLAVDHGVWSVLAHAGDEAAGRLPDQEERLFAERAMADGVYTGLGRTGLSRHQPRIVQSAGLPSADRKRSVALVPLRVGERVLGVLRLDGPIGSSPFSDAPERLLSAVASEAALAVQRMELTQAAAHVAALREADELKTALLNAVSHDLRTPLASILASAGSLLQTDVDWTEVERLDFAEAIENEAQRLDRLVGNLLDLSRIESGSLRPDKVWYDLNALIEEVLDRLRPLMPGHRLIAHLDAGLPPVELDYIEIDAVITNLVENAAKYSPTGTAIELSTSMREDAVVVQVADRGPGLPADALLRVFESFYRAAGTQAKGSGLGLAVAKGLVEAHDGHITVQNRQGGGALFAFELPLSRPPTTAVEQQRLEEGART